jgi:hypothetical protein
MIEQLRKEVNQVTNTFYELLTEMAADIDKPMSEITLNDVLQIMRKKRIATNPRP